MSSDQPNMRQFCSELVRFEAAGFAEERLVAVTGFEIEELQAFRETEEYKQERDKYARRRAVVEMETAELHQDVIHKALKQANRLLGDPNADGDYALRAAAVAHRIAKAPAGGRGTGDMAVNINAPQGLIVMQLPASVAQTIRGIDPQRIADQQAAAKNAEKFVGMSTSADLKNYLGLVDLTPESSHLDNPMRLTKGERALDALLQDDDGLPADVSGFL